MSKTLTIPWSDDLAIGGRCDRVGPVQVIMGQAITVECRSSDVPPVSADGCPLEAWLSLGRPDGTALYHWTDSRFTNRVGDFDLPLTATETALAPGTYYLEIWDMTAGNEHVLARALLNLIASPSYASIVTPPPLGIPFLSVAEASPTTFDLSARKKFKTTLTADRTFALANSVDGVAFVIRVTPAGHTITWWAGIRWAGGSAPVSSVAGDDLYSFVRDGADYIGMAVQGF